MKVCKTESLQISSKDVLEKHPFFIEIIDGFVIDSKKYIVMEFAEKGSLKKLIYQREKDNKPFSEQEIMIMFANLAFALLEINSRGHCHGNLKPDNILF
jgi:serine/threonine protein kinase